MRKNFFEDIVVKLSPTWKKKQSIKSKMNKESHTGKINSRIYDAEEEISEREDKMVKITSEEQNKVKRMKRTEGSLRDL